MVERAPANPIGERSGVEAIPVARPDASLHRAARIAAGNDDLIREALRNRGQPYVWGGASRGGFDCSGFVCYVFARQRGLKLPHSASAQALRGTPISSTELQPGDLVFFTTYRRGISHVGIYVGKRKFIHAANHRQDVRIDSIDNGYYAHRLRAARRICPIRFSPSELKSLLQDESEVPQPSSQ